MGPLGVTPAFGILLINYNHAPYIGQAIESVLHQTRSDWELAIVDDGSTDNSAEIISLYPDSRIQARCLAKNNGMSFASRVGMNALTAPIIGVLDADDVLEPPAIGTMLEAWFTARLSSGPKTAMIYSMHTRTDLALNVLPDQWQSAALPVGKTMLDVYRQGGIETPEGAGTVGPFRTFSRAAYDKTAGFEDRWTHSQDFDLTLKLEEVGPLVFVPERLYKYRINSVRHAGYPNQMHQIAREAMRRRAINP